MNDREELELAALAAGIGPLWYCRDSDVAYFGEMPHHRTFKPLTDDGDAFRLMVDLHMTVDVLPWGSTAKRWDDCKTDLDAERHNEDPRAATRRAITRAASELGRSMP